MNFAAQEAADEMMVTSIPRWPTSAPDVYLNTRKLANKNGKTPTFTDEQMYFDKFSNLPPEIQVRVLSHHLLSRFANTDSQPISE